MEGGTVTEIVRATQASLRLFAPEAWLTVGLLVLLVLDLVFRDVRKRFVLPGTAFGIALGAIVLAIPLLSHAPTEAFSGLLVVDPFGTYLKIAIGIATLLTIWVSFRNRELADYPVGEYYVLLLGLQLACMLLVGAVHFVMIMLALEMVSVSSYLLVAYRKMHRPSIEAGLKYIVFGAAATGAMLYAISWIYGLTGTLYLSEVARRLQTMPIAPGWLVVMLLLSVGLTFKIAAVPFHFWAPDAYQGAATPVAAFLTVAPKAAGFAMLVRIFYHGFSIYRPEAEAWEAIPGLGWPLFLSVVAAITMTWGNTVALWQKNMKRMLAYSSISHAGYMLMAVLPGTREGLQALLFYVVAYLVMNMGAFFTVLALSDATDQYEDIAAYQGLASRFPELTWVLAFFLLSLAGIPPFIGFFGKFFLFAAALRGGWAWLAVLAVLNSVVSLFYYVYVIKNMVIERPGEFRTVFSWNSAYRAVLVLGIAVLVLGILFSPIYGWTARSSYVVETFGMAFQATGK
ncbi:MAG: NADH-quinone oxidoreductase subunit N [Acidobacteria bacterium]|nr:NADH-quinone oxidoreductase subunit N [Acidobacteriota bacterium]MDW7983196.1 NADH-quinone oxidoreductase subunit N [Acidobacteriota bacterium]